MEPFTVHCPLGGCHGAVQLRSGVGVYYVRAYEGDPERPVGYREPDPDATVGDQRFVDEQPLGIAPLEIVTADVTKVVGTSGLGSGLVGQGSGLHECVRGKHC